MWEIFPARIGEIHVLWSGVAWDTGRLGEVRVFMAPLAPVDESSGQREMRWVWGCNIHVRDGRMTISMVQSFTLLAPNGLRVPMSLRVRLQLVRDLQLAADALHCPEIVWSDWQPGRKRAATLPRTPRAI